MLTFAVFQLVTALVGGTVGTVPLAYVFFDSTNSVGLELPSQPSRDDALTVRLKADGGLEVEGAATTEEGLAAMLSVKAKGLAPHEVRVLLLGEPGVGYEAVARVMGELSKAGYGKVGLVASQDVP
jgi:biopolymer transport protein ExbD